MKTLKFISIIIIAATLMSCEKNIIADPALGKGDTLTINNNPFIHAKGMKIMEGSGKEIYFKGVQIEGWLCVSGHQWGSGLSGETKVYEGLRSLVGNEKMNSFRKDVIENFITKKDIKAIQNAGFNLIRVPINHIALDTYNDGWSAIDSLFKWAEESKIYVLLDLHSAPSPQNTLFFGDYNWPESTLWEKDGKRDETLSLWEKMVSRYKDQKMLAGYDLLNEPDVSFINKNQFVPFYNSLIQRIRTIDKYHMIFIEGSNFAKDFSYFTSPFNDKNLCFEFHTYNFFGENLADQILKYKNFAVKNNAPIINGEFGAITNSEVKTLKDSYENKDNLVSGWVFWTWKSFYHTEGKWISGADQKEIRYVREFAVSPEWVKVMKYVSGEWFAAKPTTEEALKGMDDFINRIKIDNTSETNSLLQSLGLR